MHSFINNIERQAQIEEIRKFFYENIEKHHDHHENLNTDDTDITT
jgi:hypothetical protein